MPLRSKKLHFSRRRDPEYATELARAVDSGVEILVYDILQNYLQAVTCFSSLSEVFSQRLLW